VRPRGWVNVLLMALLVGQPAFSGPLVGWVGRCLPASAPVSSPRGNDAFPEQEEGTDAPEEESALSFHAGTSRQARRKPERLPVVSSPAQCPPGRAVARASGASPSPCPLLFAGGVLPIRC
jgi:hypothetical protein